MYRASDSLPHSATNIVWPDYSFKFDEGAWSEIKSIEKHFGK
jgi:hypothetical protein